MKWEFNFTLNHLREKYLVIHGRKQVKSCVSQCTECRRRFHKRTVTQQMAPLPKIRLERTMKPFTNTAVDYGGPYLTKQGRGKSRQKRYLCLFLCLQTHCCHLEMATPIHELFMNNSSNFRRGINGTPASHIYFDLIVSSLRTGSLGER